MGDPEEVKCNCTQTGSVERVQYLKKKQFKISISRVQRDDSAVKITYCSYR